MAGLSEMRRRRPVLKLRVSAALALWLADVPLRPTPCRRRSAPRRFSRAAVSGARRRRSRVSRASSPSSPATPAGRRRTRPTSRSPRAGPGTPSRSRSRMTRRKTSYEKLLEVFWHNVDPFQKNGQFCDHGNQYRSAIFYQDEAQRKAAEESKRSSRRTRGSRGRSRRRSSRRPRSIRPRSITRTSTRRTRCGITCTGWDAAATPG